MGPQKRPEGSDARRDPVLVCVPRVPNETIWSRMGFPPEMARYDYVKRSVQRGRIELYIGREGP